MQGDENLGCLGVISKLRSLKTFEESFAHHTELVTDEMVQWIRRGKRPGEFY